jgi:hypothetical protein
VNVPIKVSVVKTEFGIPKNATALQGLSAQKYVSLALRITTTVSVNVILSAPKLRLIKNVLKVLTSPKKPVSANAALSVTERINLKFLTPKIASANSIKSVKQSKINVRQKINGITKPANAHLHALKKPVTSSLPGARNPAVVSVERNLNVKQDLNGTLNNANARSQTSVRKLSRTVVQDCLIQLIVAVIKRALKKFKLAVKKAFGIDLLVVASVREIDNPVTEVKHGMKRSASVNLVPNAKQLKKPAPPIEETCKSVCASLPAIRSVPRTSD